MCIHILYNNIKVYVEFLHLLYWNNIRNKKKESPTKMSVWKDKYIYTYTNKFINNISGPIITLLQYNQYIVHNKWVLSFTSKENNVQ